MTVQPDLDMPATIIDAARDVARCGDRRRAELRAWRQATYSGNLQACHAAERMLRMVESDLQNAVDRLCAVLRA